MGDKIWGRYGDANGGVEDYGQDQVIYSRVNIGT